MTKRLNVEEVIGLIDKEADVILPLAAGEPVLLLDILEKNYRKLDNVRVHQMLPIRQRDYMWGEMKNHLSHVSYFLSGVNRKPYEQGTIELVPNVFHEMPRILKKTTKLSMVMAVASPMDEHGYFSLGTQADYVADFIGKVPFILEVNKHMPRTFGENQIHISQIAGFVEHDEILQEAKSPPIEEKDRKIAEFVTADIKDGDTLQIGIGAIPNAVMKMLKDRRHLGIHTEMLTDGIIDLVAAGAVDGTRKFTNRGKIVATFAYGTQQLYDFIHNNPSVEFLPVGMLNDPREVAKEENLVSINATTEVDMYGQCASETVGGRYYSSTGGQADFARAVRFSKYGKGYVCMHSTVKNDTISRIKPFLAPGSVVTTSKNDVDNIVTEYGIARLYGKSLSERAKALIAIAHPKFREELTFEAKKNGFLI
ncbi:acetyl-CoA hydrolase/transferase C-terminal domain-containing protein [Sporosarcina sp. 179-K 3D1 HS]|uniref:acetyl-CoA hydrolase/transferase family protein n=1 Tax=Sporosarcina sp. 179-K 3D1 HS TaxID=3232169 RepID=UPI0039A1852E